MIKVTSKLLEWIRPWLTKTGVDVRTRSRTFGIFGHVDECALELTINQSLIRPWPEIEGEEIDFWLIGTEEDKARQTGKIQLIFLE